MRIYPKNIGINIQAIGYDINIYAEAEFSTLRKHGFVYKFETNNMFNNELVTTWADKVLNLDYMFFARSKVFGGISNNITTKHKTYFFFKDKNDCLLTKIKFCSE